MTYRDYGQDHHVEPRAAALGYCDHCHDGDGSSVFPYVGTAPHTPSAPLRNLLDLVTIELPESEWPANFKLDEKSGPASGFPRMGIWTHCLECGAGMTEEVAA